MWVTVEYHINMNLRNICPTHTFSAISLSKLLKHDLDFLAIWSGSGDQVKSLVLASAQHHSRSLYGILTLAYLISEGVSGR